MATEQELIGALRNADAAGDTEGAQRIAELIKTARGAPQEDKLDMGVNSALQRGFAHGATFGLVPTDDATAEAHPIATAVGEGLGGVLSGAALEKGAVALASKVAPRIVQGARSVLSLKAGQPIRNAARLAGQGAASGGLYGAAAGGVSGAQDDTGAAAGAAEGAATGAAVGAVAGSALAAAAKGVQAVKGALSGVSKRAIALLAKNLDMSPDGVEMMITDHVAATGRPPTLGDILNAKSVANLEPITTAKQSTQAAMQAANESNAALLPGRMAAHVENSGATQTPFTDAPSLVAARTAPLEDMRDAQIKKTLDSVRGDRLNLTPEETDFIKGDVTSAMGLKGPIRKQIAAELEQNQLSINSADVLRRNLSKLAFAKPGEGYDALAEGVNQIARSHPEYARAIDEYAAHQRFIDGFNHANAGKSALDASGGGERAALQSAEGQAGLEVGARSRLITNAAASEAGAARTANQLRQPTPTPTNESLPAPQTERLQRASAAEVRSQQNYGKLAGTKLNSKGDEAMASAKQAGEAGVAVMAHAFPTTRFHAVSRLLQGAGVRESTAKEVVRLITSRDPADIAKLPGLLRAANIAADKQRMILAVVSRGGGRAASAVTNTGQ